MKNISSSPESPFKISLPTRGAAGFCALRLTEVSCFRRCSLCFPPHKLIFPGPCCDNSLWTQHSPARCFLKPPKQFGFQDPYLKKFALIALWAPHLHTCLKGQELGECNEKMRMSRHCVLCRVAHDFQKVEI